MIDHLQRIDDQRIVGAANAIPHQLQKTRVDHLARLKVSPLSRLAIVDMDPSRWQCWVVKRLALARRTYPHVVIPDLTQQHPLPPRGPLIEMRSKPVRLPLPVAAQPRLLPRTREIPR